MGAHTLVEARGQPRVSLLRTLTALCFEIGSITVVELTTLTRLAAQPANPREAPVSVSTGSSIPKHIFPLPLYLSPVVWVRKKGENIFEKSTKWIRQGLPHSEAGGLVTGWQAKHSVGDQLSWAGERSHTCVTHCHGVCEVPLRSSEFDRVVQEV